MNDTRKLAAAVITAGAALFTQPASAFFGMMDDFFGGGAPEAGSSIPFVPAEEDLPGSGWLALDELVSGGTQGEAELIDCVGPEFPGPDETLDSASSPHFVRPGGQLVHGIAVVFGTTEAARRAATILRRQKFAQCLGQSVVADLLAAPDDVEPLAVDAHDEQWGQRLSFTGVSDAGVLPIHLDLVVVDHGNVASLLFLADTPEPFPPEQRAHIVDRVSRRIRNH